MPTCFQCRSLEPFIHFSFEPDKKNLQSFVLLRRPITLVCMLPTCLSQLPTIYEIFIVSIFKQKEKKKKSFLWFYDPSFNSEWSKGDGSFFRPYQKTNQIHLYLPNSSTTITQRIFSQKYRSIYWKARVMKGCVWT